MSRYTWGLCMALACLPAFASPGVDDMLDRAAERNNVPRSLVHAVAMVESTKTCGARNGGSRGIMQVNKGTAKEVGVAWPFQSCSDEIEAGVRYLKKAIEKGGKGCSGITLYNTGINARPHCSDYGRKVLMWQKKM